MFYQQISENQLLDYLKFHAEQLLNIIDTNQGTQENHDKEHFATLKARLNERHLSINDLFAIEHELIHLYPDKLINSLYLEIQYKYRKALPREAAERIAILEKEKVNGNIKNNPETKKTISSIREKKLEESEIPQKRANLSLLYNYLQDYYFFINERESFIRNMKYKFIIMLAILVLMSLLSTILHYCCFEGMENLKIPLFIGMACGGYLGAIISTVQRIQKMAETPVDQTDRETTLLKVYQGTIGVYLSILLGTLSPFVIYLLILALPAGKSVTVLNFGLLPEFNNLYLCPRLENACPVVPLDEAKNIAKMLFISVLCGFSERLVPDVLDRVAKKVDGSLAK